MGQRLFVTLGLHFQFTQLEQRRGALRMLPDRKLQHSLSLAVIKHLPVGAAQSQFGGFAFRIGLERGLKRANRLDRVLLREKSLASANFGLGLWFRGSRTHQRADPSQTTEHNNEPDWFLNQSHKRSRTEISG